MKTKWMAIILVALVTVVFSLSGAYAAKLLCVSNQDLKGETTVGQCLDQGMEFAIMDAQGFVHILTPREVELTKKLNPNAFKTKAFGVKYFKLAPEIPAMPVSPEVLG